LAFRATIFLQQVIKTPVQYRTEACTGMALQASTQHGLQVIIANTNPLPSHFCFAALNLHFDFGE
jgi:hypothetical protein